MLGALVAVLDIIEHQYYGQKIFFIRRTYAVLAVPPAPSLAVPSMTMAEVVFPFVVAVLLDYEYPSKDNFHKTIPCGRRKREKLQELEKSQQRDLVGWESSPLGSCFLREQRAHLPSRNHERQGLRFQTCGSRDRRTRHAQRGQCMNPVTMVKTK